MFLNLFCNFLHELLVLVSFVVRCAVNSNLNRVFKFHLRRNATLMELGWSPKSATSSRFPEASAELELLWTHFSLSVTFGPSRGVSCLANISRFPFADNLYDAFFWHRLVRNNGVTTCPKISNQHFVLSVSGPNTLHLVQVSNEFDNALFLLCWNL